MRFLGLLHMEIVRERLEREYDLSLVATAPNVEYRVQLADGSIEVVDNPSSMPPPEQVEAIEEPFVKVTILTPTDYVGTLMELAQQRRGEMQKMEYLSVDRVELVYTLPLGEIVLDFFDQMKSRTRGYASLDYEPAGYRVSNLAKVDVLLNSVPVDAFSAIVHRAKADVYGRKMTSKLRELIPRQLFDVPIQAAIGGRIIARETVKAKRKDVLAKCYGGDITRKRKLLERQKEGKKRMKQIGRVEVPQEAFVAALRWRSSVRSLYGTDALRRCRTWAVYVAVLVLVAVLVGVVIGGPPRAGGVARGGRASSDGGGPKAPRRLERAAVSLGGHDHDGRRHQRRRDRREPARPAARFRDERPLSPLISWSRVPSRSSTRRSLRRMPRGMLQSRRLRSRARRPLHFECAPERRAASSGPAARSMPGTRPDSSTTVSARLRRSSA